MILFVSFHVAIDLDLSMFERLLLKQKSVNVVQLTIQHRMRPEIANLIRPEVYSVLLDNEKVTRYPPVLGVARNLFFWNCIAGVEEKDSALNSYANEEEAHRVVTLVSFLCKQGYGKNAITVLSPYVGQLLKLRRMLSKEHSVVVGDLDEDALQALVAGVEGEEVEEEKVHFTAPKALSSHVRIATIDNFQGEESDVIVISLVRSNKGRSIGFLKVQNRINVMLSRAKHGMFLIGNADLLERSGDPFWHSVLGKLERENLGERLPLYCVKHPETRVFVANSAELVSKCPDGGCEEDFFLSTVYFVVTLFLGTLPCTSQLSCGHVCKRFCHSDDQDHRSNKCLEPCRRVPSCGHPCRLLCYEKCVCSVAVLVSFENCSHQRSVSCCSAKSAICLEEVDKRFPCGHVCKAVCGEISDAKCSAKCGASLKTCGHSCSLLCSKCDGKNHAKCVVPCSRLQSCGHKCNAPCHGEEPCPPCKKECLTQCVHRYAFIFGKKCFLFTILLIQFLPAEMS